MQTLRRLVSEILIVGVGRETEHRLETNAAQPVRCYESGTVMLASFYVCAYVWCVCVYSILSNAAQAFRAGLEFMCTGLEMVLEAQHVFAKCVELKTMTNL